MAIRLTVNRLPSTFVFILFYSCYLIYGCGGGDGSANDTQSTTGAIFFELNWDYDSVEQRDSYSHRDGACTAYDIASISVDVKNAADTIIASQSWACSEGRNTIADVAVGSDLTLTFSGIVNGQTDWLGQATGISVIGGQQTDIGTVVMDHIAEDVTPPTISAHYPVSGGTEVPIAATITVTFSERIADDSVNSSSCTLSEDGSSDPVDCIVSYNDASRNASISPIIQLKPDTGYTVTITTEIRDLSDFHMTSDESWTFTTGGNNSDRSLIWDNRNWDGSLWN
jgi:hypothetical protein